MCIRDRSTQSTGDRFATMSNLAARVQHELSRREAQNQRESVIGPEAAELRTAYVGGALSAPGYPHLAQHYGPVALNGLEKHIGAPFGYGQDEDMYNGPEQFTHVPQIQRPVPLGGVDDYHMCSDAVLGSRRTLKEKYEACTVNHRVGYDRYGRLDYADYKPHPEFAYPPLGVPPQHGFEGPKDQTQYYGNPGFVPCPTYGHLAPHGPRSFGFGL
eukprot:TRINITY_DN9874_c0_g1_i1.p1 TRINITY_DN9874_c0_g1~~TRINITY_DN9874_c0_g1_i1.p1  ORF type:complete len:215 (+),score=42.47 TRINITY_DN9874_c0_g1_i1:93-737(+)